MNIDTIGTFGGEPVRRATLTSDAGVSVAILSYGCVVQSWRVPDRTGTLREVTLGFAEFPPYPQNSDRAFGVIAGRLANRVGAGRFTLDGADPSARPQRALATRCTAAARASAGRTIALEGDARRVRLTHLEPGRRGWASPGSLAIIRRDHPRRPHADVSTMTAVPDRPTPVSLAQHSYFALGGAPTDHRLTVPASQVVEIDGAKIATGRLLPVADSRWDFRTARPIGTAPLDINFCLDGGDPAAILEGDDFRLTIATDRPGMQAYNSYDMPAVTPPGHGGVSYGPFAGIALEAQDWPGAVNHAAISRR